MNGPEISMDDPERWEGGGGGCQIWHSAVIVWKFLQGRGASMAISSYLLAIDGHHTH